MSGLGGPVRRGDDEVTAWRIDLSGIRVEAFVGLGEQERSVSQPLGIEIAISFSTAGEIADRIEGTYDYSILDELVNESLEPRPRLLETLAERISKRIEDSDEHRIVREIAVSVTKLRPPMGLEMAGVTATLRRRLNGGLA